MVKDQKAYEIHLQGLVVDVNMRAFVADRAGWYGLVGWVQNESSDLVKIYIEGSEDDLEKFLEELKAGEDRPGRVDELTCKEVEPSGWYDRFRIERQ